MKKKEMEFIVIRFETVNASESPYFGSIHVKGCRDIDRECRRRDGYTDSFCATDAKEALGKWIEKAYLGEVELDDVMVHDEFKINPCCKKEKETKR